MGKPKKGGKKKDKDDWEDDVLNELEELKEGNATQDSAKTGNHIKTSAAVNMFNLLCEEDEQSGDEDKAPAMPQKTTKKSKKNRDVTSDDDTGATGEKELTNKNGTNEISKSKHENADNELDTDAIKSIKKSKKKKKNKDIDIDDLAMDEGELQTSMLDTDSNNLIASKDKKASKTENIEQDENESGPTVKTAAQKRAEKKEREKKKKEAEKAKSKAKAKKLEETKPDEREEEEKTKEQEMRPPEAEGNVHLNETIREKNDAVDLAEDAEGDEDEGEGDKKKKKKKKKKAGEKEEKKTKKPNKALVKQMQQQLEQLKLEEERIKREEEERQRALEEAENRRLEKLRLEQEKKDKKKQKEKERRERLKKEGKLLTKAQKQQRAQQQAQLEALKQQGIEIPALMRTQTEQDGTAVKKPVRYGSKKPKQKQHQQQQKEEKPESQEHEKPAEYDKEESVTTVDEINVDEQIEVEVENASEDEVKDAWDVESEEDEETTATAAPKRQTSKEHVASKDDDDDDESEESESDESEEDSESSEEEEDDDEEEESDEYETKPEQRKETVEERILRRRMEADAQKSTDNLRSPVVCVLGHVDTGKTKILDKIRHSHVQDGEAGGITQQIGATMVPVYAIREQTKMVKEFAEFDMKIPGLLIIDTPGHESFSNLRSRGSSLCDMAILVVDIMHGLEPQTIESLNLLKKRKTPFIVALNKVDRLFEWKRGPNSCIVDTIKKQKKNTKQEFDERVQIVINELAEQGLNAALFYNNKDTRSYVSLVPTSAHTGDGMGDLISQIVTLTQGRMANKLAFSQDLDCMVLEVKALPGLGTTIDVILVNGKLHEGDTIVLAGIEGPIVTQVRALLMPQPLKELRVKNQYVTHKEIIGAQGVKIAAKELEKALAGISLYVAQQPDEIEYFKEEVSNALSSTLKAIQLSERGVYVQASTLGSLEALLEFLRTSKIPYAGVNIGPVHRRDIMKCSIMLEHDSQYAVVLAFDVRVERDAQEMADQMGVKIFAADIIYHLFDKFTAYREEIKMKKRDEFRSIAIFPCKLRVLPQHIFNSRDPIVVGVVVEGGIVKEGTPIVVPSKSCIDIGVVTGIEANHKAMESARKGMEVCIKIEPTPGDTPKLYGRHFDHTDLLVSKISRQSIDAVKDYFRDDMQKSDWQLMIELKKLFEIL